MTDKNKTIKAPWAQELPDPNPVVDPETISAQKLSEETEYENEPDKIIIWFDGSANPNPGLGGLGIVVIDGGKAIHEESILLNPDQRPTPLGNNQAEMYGLERSLQIAKVIQPKYPEKAIEIRTDSNNVANMFNGIFNAKKLKPEYERCDALRIPGVTVVQIPEVDPRHCARADELAGLATGTYV